MTRKLLIILLLCAAPMLTRALLPHKDSSVLASGRWFRMAVTHTGIHQVAYADLLKLGIDPGTLDPDKIRIFGNGSGSLPESNNSARIDDLREIAIQVRTGNDGRFDPGDDLLFYGEEADKWYYDRNRIFFIHQKNLYSDTTYYYLNISAMNGARVRQQEPVVLPASRIVTRFNDRLLHELDSLSLLKSGREWYGEVFDKGTNSRTFTFDIPGIDTSSIIRLRTFVVAKAPNVSFFYLSLNNKLFDSLKVDSSPPGAFTLMGRQASKTSYLSKPTSNLAINVTYKLPTVNSMGWLNFLELSFARELMWLGPQTCFRDGVINTPPQVSEYQFRNSHPGTRIWDVSDPSSITELQSTIAGGILHFTQLADSAMEYVAFDETLLYEVVCRGEVPNQNLHASEPADLVIVTDPQFLSQAEQLADFHKSSNNLSVLVVTTNQVFNEFSSGQHDPTAIRDFMKLLYDRSGGARPKYLLLFGDGSYDPKNRIPGNNNLIPTFQSQESLAGTGSYVTDDYFGIMGDEAGQNSNGKIDIGIGRLPVSNTEEAQTMIDKIIHYDSKEAPVRSAWRNMVTFVADDENDNLHLHQAEELCAIVAKKYPVFNIEKIYFDAYQIETIPGGLRFPDATTAINKAVQNGSLIINYTGHGGETGWSYEQALTTSDIESWDNSDKLPVFVTATCEFSRFDNPERFTAGEMVILHPEGGAIALYSTTRLAFAGSNIKLDTSFFHHLMDKNPDGNYVKMGDLIKLSKNNNGNSESLRNFVLLGDPAQNIAFPELKVATRQINQQPVNEPDTTRGMSLVTVRGRIENDFVQTITGFQGTLNCKVYDKPVTYTTLGNREGDAYPENFVMQNSLLFSGDVPVNNGLFQVTFLIPKSISLSFGNGRISYYANSSDQDAWGYSDKIVIGGTTDIDPRNSGPDIALYLDNRNFVSGARTGKAPLLIADLYDTNGINAFGLGIGHEIEATIDNDRAHSMVLNDYYSQQFNSYTRGTLSFQLPDQTTGMHTLSLKAWDLFDNSSEKEITYYVWNEQNLVVKNVMNVPNPVFDHTTFIFQPQQPVDGPLEVQIQIFDLNGQMVHKIQSDWFIPTDKSGSMTWDGTDANGNPLKSGLYPYKVIFTGKDGIFSETTQKLVIIR